MIFENESVALAVFDERIRLKDRNEIAQKIQIDEEENNGNKKN